MNGLSTESNRIVGIQIFMAMLSKRPVSLTVYTSNDDNNKYGKQTNGLIAEHVTHDKCAISLTLIQMFIVLIENYDNNTVTVCGCDFIV